MEGEKKGEKRAREAEEPLAKAEETPEKAEEPEGKKPKKEETPPKAKEELVEVPTRKELEKLTVKLLKEKLKERQVLDYSGLKKDLVSRLLKSYEAA